MQIVTNEYQKEMKTHGSYQFPFLLSRETLSSYESGSFLWHWHREIELTLILHGEMIYRFANQSFHVRAGDALFGNSNAMHAGEMVPEPQKATQELSSPYPAPQNTDCEYLSITFDPRLIYGYENSLIKRRYVDPIIHNPALTGLHFDGSKPYHSDAIALIREIVELQQSACQSAKTERETLQQEAENPVPFPASELETTALLLRLWKLIYLHNAPDGFSQSDRVDQERIRRLLEYIAQHYDSKIYLEDAAAHIGLCKSECCRLFKRHMKVTLFSFLLDYRIEKSLEFLAQPDVTVTEAAEKSGFEDSNYYSKVFRRRKGCSPTSYRRRFLHLP